MMELKKYQKFRDSCKFCTNKDGEGLWCIDKNFKCSFDNCSNYSNPLISCGTPGSKKGVGINGGNDGLGVTEKQVRVFKLKESGLSFQKIGDKLGMTKKNAWKLYQKAIRVYKYKGGNDRGVRVTKAKEGGNDIRLHNDSFSFRIGDFVFNSKDDNLRHLKYTSYVNLNFDDFYVKIFGKKLLVGFRKDIVCKSVKACKVLAEKRIKFFLSSFSYPGLVLSGKTKQVSRHYAILGSELAKKFVREREKIIVYDRVDGKVRIRVDFSNEKPEFEAEHLVHGDTSAEKWHSIIDDVEHKPSYLPSVSTMMIDNLMGDYIKSQKDFDSRMQWMAENNKSHQAVLEDMKEVQKETLKFLKEIAKK